MGKLTTIKRFKSGRVFEYKFEYLKAENKFNIKLVVEYDGKRKASKNNYYVVLNKNYKLTDIRIDVYVKKEIKYNKAGDILTSSFARVDKNNVEFGREYKELDNKGNWLERSFKKNVFQRQIEYL